MKSVYCVPAVNEVYDAVKQCRNYEAEIQFLKKELAMHDTLTNRSQVVYEPLSETQCNELKEEVKRYIARETPSIEIVNVRQINTILEIFRDMVDTVETSTEQKLRKKYDFHEKDAAEVTNAEGI